MYKERSFQMHCAIEWTYVLTEFQMSQFHRITVIRLEVRYFVIFVWYTVWYNTLFGTLDIQCEISKMISSTLVIQREKHTVVPKFPIQFVMDFVVFRIGVCNLQN